MRRIECGAITVVVLLVCHTSPGQEEQNPIPIIDVHAHCFEPEEYFQNAGAMNLKSMSGCPAAETRQQLMEETEAQWARNNVKFAVVSGFRSRERPGVEEAESRQDYLFLQPSGVELELEEE